MRVGAMPILLKSFDLRLRISAEVKNPRPISTR